MKYDIENRLIEFSCTTVGHMNFLKYNLAGKYLKDQLVRSSLSCALNYGEVLGAESRKDFIHKNKLILKELRESSISLKIIEKLCLSSNMEELMILQKENSELIAIFQSTVKTAERNNNKTKY